MRIGDKAVFKADEIKVLYHAKERMAEKFGVTDHEEAERVVKDRLQKSTYLGRIMTETGKINRLFAYGGIAYILDKETAEVITIYERKLVHSMVRLAELKARLEGNDVKDEIIRLLNDMEQEEEEHREKLLRLELELEICEALVNVGFKELRLDVRELQGQLDRERFKLRNFMIEKSKVTKGASVYF